MSAWLTQLSHEFPVAHAVLVVCVVAATGLALGAVRYRGVGLGVAGTLFAGLMFGHFGWSLAAPVRAFLQDFGLILFVYATGVQVGPAISNALKRHGLPLNVCAALIVLLGAGLTLALARGLNIEVAAAVGIFAGATTNTPALGAAEDVLRHSADMAGERVSLASAAYAAAYPFGILGIILAMLLVRLIFRIQPREELGRLLESERAGRTELTRVNLVVENPNLDGIPLRELPGLQHNGTEVVVSRVKHANSADVGLATPETHLRRGDTLLAVGTAEALDRLRLVVGRVAEEDLVQMPGFVDSRRVVLTRRVVAGKTLRELALDHRYGVIVTRISRAEVELPVNPEHRVQLGDMLQMVGSREDLERAAAWLGNSLKELNHTQLIPIFVGIVLGVLVGMAPLPVPGMPAPLRLGLAGGPLIVAIVLSKVGRIGPLVWYLPTPGSVLLRELGIVLFLACVGLRSGGTFVETLTGGAGLTWVAVGAAITMLPLLMVAVGARLVMKLNYVSICGLLAGSMTDPPALAFANSVTDSDAPATAYAAVYPLTMVLRIAVAQAMVLMFV